MSVYWRYKQNPGGFRNLVELLESTPPSRRQKMIDVGLAEDPGYTMDALKYMLSFDDIICLPDGELAEVMANSPPRILAYALQSLDDAQRKRFLQCTPRSIQGEVTAMLEGKASDREVSGARMKLIVIARELERKGLVKAKIIPTAA